MAKITTKAGLTLGTNLKFHIADKSGTDIAIAKSGATLTITTTAANFTGSSETAGVVNRAIAIGDVIKLSNTGNASNEGLTATVSAVSATSITATIVSGTGATETAGADINIVAIKKTYQFLAAGGLSFIDGVQGIILASKMVDLWDTSDLDKYDPAFTSIEPRAKSIASINGWEPHDISTTNAVRDTALEIRPSKTAAATKIYALLRSTSNAHAPTDQITYWYGGDAELTAPNDFVMTGYANQLVLLYDYNSGTPIDKRGTWYTRLAIEGKTIIMEQHALNYAEIIPISAANAIDPKLIVADATIAAGGIFANITYNLDVDGIYSGNVDGSNYNFAGYVDGDLQTNEAVHQKINYLWRQPTNVNSDGTGATKRGDKQWPLTVFSGDAFTVKAYLLDYKASQRNNLTLVDSGGNNRAWPAIYTLTPTAPSLAVGGTFSLIHEDTFGTATPVYLKNEAGTDQKDITIAASQDIVVAYSTYNNGGHPPNTPIPLRLTWNRPGFIEPENTAFTLGPANMGVAISPTADPSYTAA
jgi:hypothetical protein